MRKNNFDIIRLLLALIVVLVHSYDLSQSSALSPIRALLSARMGVECFFVISGFLIFASYERCATLREYFSNRAFRILPGYWLSTALCLAIAFAYGSFHVGKFLLANLTFANFLHPGIAGVFSHNPAGAMNGALWTIKTEVMFYLSVPIIGWACRKLRRDAVLGTLIVISIVFHQVFARHETIAVQLPGQLSFFLVGTLIYYHLDDFRRYGWWIMLAAALLFALHTWTGWYPLRPLALAPLVLGISLLLPQFRGPTRWGDFSYGTYILHWPILQLFVQAGWFAVRPWRTLLLAVVVVGTCAVISWNLVEKPSLAHARSRRLRLAAQGQGVAYPPAVP